MWMVRLQETINDLGNTKDGLRLSIHSTHSRASLADHNAKFLSSRKVWQATENK